MIDNEKRAHDLALLYIKEQIDQNIVEIDSTDDLSVGLFTDDYLNIYSRILDDLNRHSM